MEGEDKEDVECVEDKESLGEGGVTTVEHEVNKEEEREGERA